MKQANILLLLLVFVPLSKINGQKEVNDDTTQVSKKSTPASRVEFYNYFLPTSIAKQDFAPGIISNISLDFGDEEITFKAGNASKKTKDEKSKVDTLDQSSFKNSWFVGAGITAENSAAKFFSKGRFNPGYSLKGGYTFKTNDIRWNYKDYPDSISSRRFIWVNIVGKINWNSFNIFSTDSTYKKKTPMGFQVMIFWNNYFHSRIPRFKYKNSVLSVGLGIGRFNNYPLLGDEFSLLEGKPLNNGSFVQTDEIKGRKGDFNNFIGGVYAFDIYKSIIRAEKATMYFGIRANGFFGPYSTINTSAGLYFSSTSVKGTEKEEKFGLVISGHLPNTQKISSENYFRKKAYLNFSAIIPLKFSL